MRLANPTPYIVEPDTSGYCVRHARSGEILVIGGKPQSGLKKAEARRTAGTFNRLIAQRGENETPH